MKLIEIVLEIIGWLQIVFSATFTAGFIAFVTYLKWSNETGKIVAIIITSIGFILGVLWGTWIWRKHGTVAWLSRIR